MKHHFLISILASATPLVVYSAPLYDTRIIGGDPVDSESAYPYFADIDAGCGGAVIAPNVVLTAAHCNSLKFRTIYVGGTTVRDTNAVTRRCDEWVNHPQYDYPDYDFALCKLNDDVIIDESEVKLELNFDSSIPSTKKGQMLTLIGMGYQEYDFDTNTGYRDDKLYEVEVPYVNNAVCDRLYDDFRPVTDRMICAGYIGKGGKDSCAGDSGAPVLKIIENDDLPSTHLHVGLTSWGYDCALKQLPGVSARTSEAELWIKSTVCHEWGSDASFCDTTNPQHPGCVDRNEGNKCRNAFEGLADDELEEKCGEKVSRNFATEYRDLCPLTCGLCDP